MLEILQQTRARQKRIKEEKDLLTEMKHASNFGMYCSPLKLLIIFSIMA